MYRDTHYFSYFCSKHSLIEPRYEKTGFFAFTKTKTEISFAVTDQRLCFRYTDSTIPLLPKTEISSLWPSSVVVQPGLCRTWSETPKTGFLTTFVYSRNKKNTNVFRFCRKLSFLQPYIVAVYYEAPFYYKIPIL